jgi:hypothetical protein
MTYHTDLLLILGGIVLLLFLAWLHRRITARLWTPVFEEEAVDEADPDDE